MLGVLIAALDDPAVSARVLSALDGPDLSARLAAASEADGRAPCEVMAALVRNFLDSASDEQFVQLIGIMNRAEDPGLAAVRAILSAALPEGTA
ncbi:hypothetical protein V5F77_04595 [Xanthobacter sp. DSM 24535]|uniref:hypothetical protein n=1 Tax=Roseixanthobacter psychrophilus TaxID=3119917 RepID=UPI00372C67A2